MVLILMKKTGLRGSRMTQKVKITQDRVIYKTAYRKDFVLVRLVFILFGMRVENVKRQMSLEKKNDFFCCKLI